MKNYQLYVFDWQGTLLDTSGLFPHVVELLDYLHAQNIKIALATNLSRDLLHDILPIFSLSDKFDYIRTPSECRAKPDPDMINSIIAASGINKEQVVMIGDAPTDIQMARLAGVDGIGIASDKFNHQLLQLESPLHIFTTITDLYQTITRNT